MQNERDQKVLEKTMSINLETQQCQKNKEVVLSQSIKEYIEFFQDVQDKIKHIDQQNISGQLQNAYRIKILKEKTNTDKILFRFGDCYFGMKGTKKHGLTYIYDVLIGKFYLRIHILNLNTISQYQETPEQHKLGQGAYGCVRQVQIMDKKLAVKRIKFLNQMDNHTTKKFINFDILDKADYMQIRNAIRQYCIYKICSMLDIGPTVISRNNYDLVCYNDCMEFQMELCSHPISNRQLLFYSSYALDLKYSLKLLHKLKFIHKDIKPDNILYSFQKQKFVLSDFGLTHTIKQNLGEKTYTAFQGTHPYCSREMAQLLFHRCPGYVDLYLNDSIALKMTLEWLEKKQMQFNVPWIQNIMSHKSSGNSLLSQKSIQRFQLPITGGSTALQSTLATNQQIFSKYSCEINLYLNKIINMVEFSSKQLSPENIKQIVWKICECQKNQDLNQHIYQNVMMLIQQKFTCKEQQAQFTLKNLVRHFGLYSTEVQSCIRDYILIIHNKQQIQRYQQILNQITKKPYFEKIKDLQLQTNLMLHDRRSLVASFKNTVKQYRLKTKQPTQKQIQLLQLLYLQVVNSQQIKLQDYKEVNKCISNFFKQYKNRFLQITQEKNRHGNCQCGWCLKFSHIKMLNSLFEDEVSQHQQNITKDKFIFLCKLIFSMFAVKEDSLKIIKKIQILKQMYQKHKNKLAPDQLCQISYRISHLIFCVEARKKTNDKKGLYTDNQSLQIALKYLFQSLCLLQKISKEYSTNSKTKLNFPLVKCKLKDLIGRVYQYLNDAQTSKKYILESLKQKQQYYYPIKMNEQIANSYKQMGNIYLHFNELNLAQQYLSEYIRSMNQQKGDSVDFYVQEAYNSLALIYQKKNEFNKVLEICKRSYVIKLAYQRLNEEELSYIVQNILICYLKINNIEQDMSGYVRLMVRIKINFLTLNKINFRKFKQVLLFHFQRHQNLFNQQNIIKLQKIFVKQTEQFLHITSYTYRYCCFKLGNYYMKDKHYIKAIKYLWKYLENTPIGNFSIQDFTIVLYLGKLLRKCNMNRRALSELSKYIYFIPDSMIQIRKKAFKMFSQLHEILQMPLAKFYNNIFDSKVFITRDFKKLQTDISNSTLKEKMEFKMRQKRLKMI